MKDNVEVSYLVRTRSCYLACETSGCRNFNQCFVKTRIDPREFSLNLSAPPSQVIRSHSRTDR